MPDETFLNETFDTESPDPLLSWLNPPRSWRVDASRSVLIVEPDSETDFWQRTHYEFSATNGHLLKKSVSSDVVVATQIQSFPVHQYDQAGLMIWFSADCWLKTSVEFEPGGPCQLGAVVTNHGYSDWSLQEFPHNGILAYSLRIRREGNDFLVEHSLPAGETWKLMRVAHLSPEADLPCQAGLYACSPKGGGFRAEFDYLTIRGSL